jgi:hypothetical protein
MRLVLQIAILVLVVLGTRAEAQTPRKACPSSAERAGYSLWAPRSLKPAEVKRGRHACGRLIECTGARLTDTTRTCRWL